MDGEDFRHVGCSRLLDTIVMRVKPKVHVFGHVHFKRGVHVLQLPKNQDQKISTSIPSSPQIVFINAAVHRGRYLNQPIVFDYYYD